MSNHKNKIILERFISEVWSKGNLDVVDELVAPQYVISHDPGDPWDGKTLDLTKFKKRVMHARNIFPDLQFNIEDAVCEGNKVAISWYFRGTQTGDIPGLPATRNTVKVSGLTIYSFSDGKLAGHWQIFDRLGLIEQLSVNRGGV